MTKKIISRNQKNTYLTNNAHIFDNKDKLILAEIVKNPRISDAEISIQANLPAKTVARRRQALEEKNLLTYSAHVNNFTSGTAVFNAMHLYHIYFNFGITKHQIYSIISNSSYRQSSVIKKHILSDFIGEKNGKAIYTIFLVSRKMSDMVEILNAEIIPLLENYLGKNPISLVEEIKIDSVNKFAHNYFVDFLTDKEKLERSIEENHLFITE